ncbi:MAG: hypothetical protein JOY71_14395 [Acetobacteraceae bacterium]|nr:hypothetical protein [Acetobacteraceae bacterium]
MHKPTIQGAIANAQAARKLHENSRRPWDWRPSGTGEPVAEAESPPEVVEVAEQEVATPRGDLDNPQDKPVRARRSWSC